MVKLDFDNADNPKADKEALVVTSATRQVRQRWFSVCIFPLVQLFGLTGNRPQSAPACSFLRYNQP
jgi:hypothetical protein